MTLLEVVVTITILSVVAAVLLPVINGATDSYAAAASLRDSSERVAFALDRSIRLLRDAPVGAAPGQVGIVMAQADRVRFTDGRGLELSGSDLLLRTGASTTAPLCRGVTGFELSYFAQDGVTSTAASPADTQRIWIRISTARTSLAGSATIRARMVSP